MDDVAITLPAGIEPFTRGGLSGVRVSTDRCSGEVTHAGAQVLQWTPAHSRPVYFVAEQSKWQSGTAVRGGAPLCSPWFGPGRNGDRKPQHGFLKLAVWELVEADVTDQVATLRYRLTPDHCAGLPGTESYPSKFRFEYTVTMGERLTLSLTSVATDEPLDVEEAIHSYFAVTDVHHVQVTGLDGCEYRDKVADGAIRTQSGPVLFTGETDRVYEHAGPTTIVDRDRNIHVEQSHAGNVVVWNAWAEKAAALPDMGDDEWPGYVCVESANAFQHHLTLAPGQSHTLTQQVSVQVAG